MELEAVSPNHTGGVSPAAATSGLEAGDFLQLLITQLTHQDPLEPTDNQALLDQLSSIREIELSTTLTNSLKALTGNQRYGAAASLIGKLVTGVLGDEETGLQDVSGRVTGVQFDESGGVTLQLDGGVALPIERLRTVTDPFATPESLIGRWVRGRDADADDPTELIEGVVTGSRRDGSDRVMLELDTGEELNLSDLISVT